MNYPCHFVTPTQYADAKDQQLNLVLHRAAELRGATLAEVVRRQITMTIAARWDHHRLARY